MEYNSERDQLILMEYGRNVQKLVEYISTIDDIDKRTAYSHALINLMKMLNPSVKENSDNPQRIWDHLYVMADFKLDINGPYPKPDPEELFKKPEPLPYRTTEVKFKNYGRNIELLVAKAMGLEDKEEQTAAFINIARLVKVFYSSWHQESIEDEVIIEHLKELSDNKIDLTDLWKESRGQLFNSPGDHAGNNQTNNQRHNNRTSTNPKTGQSNSNRNNRGRGRGRGRK